MDMTSSLSRIAEVRICFKTSVEATDNVRNLGDAKKKMDLN